MTYSREDFLSDLSRICDSEDKIKILSEKTDMQPILDDGEIKGYNGIITFDKLDKNNPFERRIYDTCHRFMYNNEVITGDEKLDDEVNKIIKAAPEFINTIGKKQHGTHKYTLDVHQLLMLAYSIQNPDYQKLNNIDKIMLKTSAIFHDIAKPENEVDKGHQYTSSIYARSIIKKFFNNGETRDRVYELIKNHHWLEEYATSGSNKDAASQEIAYKFRRPNDFEIAKIMAKSDLMAVGKDFYESHKNALGNYEEIDNNLENFYSTGCAIFSNYPSGSPLKMENVEIEGKKCKVINLCNAKDDENMADYGFKGVNRKNDLNFLVHMVDSRCIRSSLDTLKMLTSPVNGGVLSESLISPEYKRTYCDRKYGVILSQNNANVINVSDTNQGSGYEKEFKDIMRFVFGYSSNTRTKFKEMLLEKLDIDSSSVSKKEFADFFRDNIVSKESLQQYVETRQYKLGGKTFTGKELKTAIAETQNSLIDKNEKTHNEVVGYIPKIKALVAKEVDSNKLPLELVEFAEENNLPIVLI